MNCSIIYVFVTCVLIEQIYTIHNKYSLTSSSSSTIFAFYTRPEDPQLASSGRGWSSSCAMHRTCDTGQGGGCPISSIWTYTWVPRRTSSSWLAECPFLLTETEPEDGGMPAPCCQHSVLSRLPPQCCSWHRAMARVSRGVLFMNDSQHNF